MPRLLNVMPFLRCADIDSAIEFFTALLGFERVFREGPFARVSRDPVTFLLMGEEEALPARGGFRYTSYVDVDDVDALFAELKPGLDRLPPGGSTRPATWNTASATSLCWGRTETGSASARRSADNPGASPALPGG
jgi:hypothetical protein